MPRLIKAALERARLDSDVIATGVDVIGDIAIVRVTELKAKERRDFGNALLGELSNVKSVFGQEGPVEGEFRLRRLRFIAGEKRTVTTHRENGCSFKVDVASCYFSPRLSTERLRVAQEVRHGERVLNMFAGVGPFSIPIAKKGNSVISCEVNEAAARLHSENNRVNRVEGLVSVMNEDASRLPDLLKTRFDRVLMPHPSKADRFVPAALALTKRGGSIHYYRHVLGEDEEEATAKVKDEIASLFPSRSRSTVRRVRFVGPRWVEMVADVRLPV